MSTMDSDRELVINDTFYHVNYRFNGVTVSFRCVDIPLQNVKRCCFALNIYGGHNWFDLPKTIKGP